MKIWIVGLIAVFGLAASAEESKKNAVAEVKKTETKTEKKAETASEKTEKDTAEPAKDQTKGTVAEVKNSECKSGDEVRQLNIVDKDGGCEVEYVKGGETKVIGNAKNDKFFCGTLVARVRDSLEKSGFECTEK